MKKSQKIALVLISAALASCHKEKEWNEDNQKVYMRGDSTAVYSQTHHHNHNMLLWYTAFRPYGMYHSGTYVPVGMYGEGLSERANIGRNSVKTSVMSSSRIVASSKSSISSRGGFGSSAGHSSSSHSSAS